MKKTRLISEEVYIYQRRYDVMANPEAIGKQGGILL